MLRWVKASETVNFAAEDDEPGGGAIAVEDTALLLGVPPEGEGTTGAEGENATPAGDAEMSGAQTPTIASSLPPHMTTELNSSSVETSTPASAGSAASAASTPDPTTHEPQVSNELHPPPSGLPSATATATATAASTAPSAENAVATSDAVPSSSAVAKTETEPEAEAEDGDVEMTEGEVAGTEKVAREADPETKGMGEDVVAVVHEQPDGVRDVKVVE